MKRHEIRSLILKSTDELVQEERVFNNTGRMIYRSWKSKNIGECNKGHKSIGDPHVEHLHKIRAQGNNCSRNAIKSSTSNVLSSEIQIPGQVDGLQLNTKKWIKIFKCNEKGFLKDFPNLKQASHKYEAAKNLQKFDAITFLAGKVLEVNEGLISYQAHGPDYTGHCVFNLGRMFNFKWFSTDQYIELSQPHNVRETIPCNCDIVVLNINEKPVPVVFATKAIQRDEMLSICLETITKFNEDYFSRREKYTEDGPARKSSRIPNKSALMESLYETHLLNNTHDGVKKKFISNEKGYGLVASKKFESKEFIIEYKGDLLKNEDGIRQYNELSAEHGSFLFFLGKHYSNQWVDATKDKSSLARYINHSKKNANSKVICRIVEKTPRIFVIASKDISEGDEILYDYFERNENFEFLKH